MYDTSTHYTVELRHKNLIVISIIQKTNRYFLKDKRNIFVVSQFSSKYQESTFVVRK